MFRLSQFMQALVEENPITTARKPKGPVVIWNLIRRCNLTCKHCYAISADYNFPGELNTEQVYQNLDDLKSFGVPVLILSGGEPLLRPDILDIGKRAKAMGFYVGLSSNGTLIDSSNIQAIAEVGFDYIGISIDGIEATHDKFRQKQGAYQESMSAIRLCRDHGLKVGLRFTLTQDNADELPTLLKLMQTEKVHKFYLSHLNYAGRGNRNRKDDVVHQITRKAMDLLFEQAWQDIQNGLDHEYVTGNNDADGIYFLQWVAKNHPDKHSMITKKLESWGGNSTGVNIANIDNLGEVHPDTFWWDYSLGNVKNRKFSEIWQDTSDPLMAGFKASPRQLKGRCGDCQFQQICNGNTRVRAWQLTGDAWQEDPACYLTDEEIGVETESRLEVTPYRRQTDPHKVNQKSA
ncbi:MAG: heme d1 biosynthesis radical SAM protein NirJ [Methylococcales bacterium]|jgi:Fe-coproporphyrin III synthase|nr:heme d1 biosynthesis radical SAM protein NirJ [Methylococcales bacterium]MBT7408287.1 heme d1 biosynthesis radical SAM protein NirJ [Methylococcales bacterium]